MFLYLLLTFFSLVSATTSDCSSSSSLAKNLKIQLIPDSPKIGDKFNISLNFDLMEQVTSGFMDLKITLSGFPVYNQELNLCDELSKNNISCPLNIKNYDITWTSTIPSDSPHGTYQGTESWLNIDRKDILCFKYQYSL